jgi:hypothetical protein
MAVMYNSNPSQTKTKNETWSLKWLAAFASGEEAEDRPKRESAGTPNSNEGRADDDEKRR